MTAASFVSLHLARFDQLHRQATHKRQMDGFRTIGNADRASFTRLTALSGTGSWYGRDPVALDRSGTQGRASRASARLRFDRR